MKARKRKADKSRDSPDAKRTKTIRRGKGPLVPPQTSNAAGDCCEAGSEEANVCAASSLITIPVSQNGRRVSAPKRLSDDSQVEAEPPNKNGSAIPTPGYRLVTTFDDDDVVDEMADTDSEAAENVEAVEAVETGLNRIEETSNESHRIDRRSSSSSSRRCAGKTIFKGVLDRGRLCCCSVLVIEFDRGWREPGATVEMFSGHRGWYICVLLQEDTLFIQEIRRKYFNYTTNKVTGAYIWRAEKGWMLEFDTYSELSAFKKLYEKCFQKNQQALSSLQSPAPKFRVVKDLDPRWRGPAFIRPADGYIPVVDIDMDARVLYDMDSEDEEWLKVMNGKPGTIKKISEHKFEKAIYCMEKYSHDREQLISAETASVLCLHVASLKIVRLVHSYWIEKRLRRGKSLVRHFQSRHLKLCQEPEPETGSAKSSSENCTPREEESPRQNNSSDEMVIPAKEAPTITTTTSTTTNIAGLENVADSPSLPEVCDEAAATTTAAAEEAESSRPVEQGELVWKKFTGRASAEERKKLKIMNQLRESGIKHFTRRSKVPKLPKNSSVANTTTVSGNESITVEEAARELFALADVAMLKEFSPASKEDNNIKCGDSVLELGKESLDEETESEIETLELAREKAPGEQRPRMSKLQRQKHRLKQQMKKLRHQMKAVDDQMKTRSSTRSGLDELAAWSLEIESSRDLSKQHNRAKQLLQQQQQQRQDQQQQQKKKKNDRVESVRVPEARTVTTRRTRLVCAL